MLKKASGSNWNYENTSDLYQVERWSQGFFSIESNGHLHVCPGRDETRRADVMSILAEARRQGCDAPLLLRFPEICQQRLRDIQNAFNASIAEFDYERAYTCIYPIKVNQQRQVMEAILSTPDANIGLEAGSKAELLAIIAHAKPGVPILCNGFKDSDYIEMAMRARQLGLDTHLIIEKPTEIALAAAVSRRLGIRPKLGIRVKLAARGSGHWEATGGHKSKFGLTATEVVMGVQQLRDLGLDDCVKILHFHIGSQIPNIRRTKAAVIEATRIYSDLIKGGLQIETIDVGGGLGVDYSGAQNTCASSMNYTLQEYANDVVYYIRSVCEQAKVPCPNIYSESGRALVAHHALVVFPVFGSSSYQPGFELPNWRQLPINTQVQPLVDLMHALNDLSETTVLESYHDAQQAFEIALNLFNSGYLTLQDRAMAETMYREVCRKVSDLMAELDFVPRELENLRVILADIYYGNFSLFRSLPDHWAIGQLFPVMPLHRLNERPTNHAVLSDITCDSDGKLNRFIDPKGERTTLNLHRFDGETYYIGVFLAGAYQEILGDNHNLLGDIHVGEVTVSEEGVFELELSHGKGLEDMLESANHQPERMQQAIAQAIEEAIHAEVIPVEMGMRFHRFYQRMFRSYCYLNFDPEAEAEVPDPATTVSERSEGEGATAGVATWTSVPSRS